MGECKQCENLGDDCGEHAPDEIDQFLYQLENNIERAESPDWCVLHLNVQQGENLVRIIRELISTANAKVSGGGAFPPSA